VPNKYPIVKSKTTEDETGLVLVETENDEKIKNPKPDILENLIQRFEDLEQKLNSNINNFNKKFAHQNNVIIALVSLIFILIGGYFITLGSNSRFESSSSPEQISLNIPKASNQENGKLIVSKFAGNPAINDTGSKINVAQNRVATISHPNCQTPIIPPEINGCGFVIIPNLLGLPKKGISFNSIQLFGSIDGQSEIIINQRNYQTGQTERQIGLINATTLQNQIALPADLTNSDGLYFRFWDKGGEINITNIIVNYSNIQDLNSVEGTLDADPSFYLKKAVVYWDVNENSTFEPDVDKVWAAKNNFTGVKAVEFDSQGKFKLFRDETSFKLDRPKNWENDNLKFSLPAGKWLIVFEDTGKAIGFELTTKSDSISLQLKI